MLCRLRIHHSTAGHHAVQAYMIETAERAQERYEKKGKKKPAPAGVSSFNAKALYKAYLKRTGNVPTTPEEYQLMKETAPEFYRAADSMLYGVRDVPVLIPVFNATVAGHSMG